MSDLRAVALAALAEVRAEHGDNGTVIRTLRLVRERRTDADFRTALEAVRWAVDRPPAAELPRHSIVGSKNAAWYKFGPRGWWSTTSPRMFLDSEIDEMLRDDRATVLRVGGL